MAANVEKIKEMLGSGLNNEVVATAVGVSPSYISQLMGDETFQSEVVTLRAQALMGATKRDNSWDSIEDRLLGKLSEQVDQGLIFKPTDVIRALTVVNRAQRRGVHGNTPAGLPGAGAVVNLIMPVQVVNKYRKTVHNEVIEVTDADTGKSQTLVTMQSATLMRKLTEQHQGDTRYDKVRRSLYESGEAEKST